MTSPGIKWFAALSLVVHGAVLTAWQQHPLLGNHSVHMLELTLINTPAAATTTAPASIDHPSKSAPAERPPAQARPEPPRQTRVAARPQAPARAATTGNSRPVSAVNEETTPATTQAAVATARPAHDREESDRQLRASVLELVARQLKYPAIARRKGWQGIVRLELHIEPDGRISRLQINRTSGYPVLDNAAAESLQLATVPNAGQWLNERAVDLIVPVEYRLLDS